MITAMVRRPRRHSRLAARLRALTAIVVIACAVPSKAAATENDTGAWATGSLTDAFASGGSESRWRYWVDAQARYFDLGSGITQYVVRPAIGYDITGNVSGWLGYARVRASNRAGDVVHENRYWQQVDWAARSWLGGSVSMRTRLEQRSLSISDDVGLVLRHQVGFSRPLSDDGRRYLALSVEPFVDLVDTDWGGSAGMAQNRAFAGLGWRLTRELRFEAGYMNQYVWLDGRENLINHLLMLNFKLTP